MLPVEAGFIFVDLSSANVKTAMTGRDLAVKHDVVFCSLRS